MTSDEFSQAIADKDREILNAQVALNTVQEAQYRMKKELMDLTEGARQGKFNLARMKVERQILERSFWASRS